MICRRVPSWDSSLSLKGELQHVPGRVEWIRYILRSERDLLRGNILSNYVISFRVSNSKLHKHRFDTCMNFHLILAA